MDATRMDAIVAAMRPDDVEDALRLVEILVRSGVMDGTTADEWRRRIHARGQLLGLERDATPN